MMDAYREHTEPLPSSTWVKRAYRACQILGHMILQTLAVIGTIGLVLIAGALMQ